MKLDEVDIDPEDPDGFLVSDTRKFYYPQDIAAHDAAQRAWELRRQREIEVKRNTSETLRFGALRESHVFECECSYCGNNYDRGLKDGLNVPKSWWQFNAWWVISKPGPAGFSRTYLRFTPFSWLRGLQLFLRKVFS